jgi:hypothetical protein
MWAWVSPIYGHGDNHVDAKPFPRTEGKRSRGYGVHTIAAVLLFFERRMRVMWSVRLRLPSLVIIVVLMGGPALAQNLDDGKSGAQLFAANCANCHHSPRSLAQDKSSWTLSSFLHQHYATSSASAQAITAYLQSVDAPRAKSVDAPRGKSNAREKDTREKDTREKDTREKDISGLGPPPRPPASVPAH